MVGADYDDDKRAQRDCRRLDLPPVEAKPVPRLIMAGYMGRAPVPGLTQIRGIRVNPKLPLDDPDDGCPGAWVHCRFVHSLARFLRRRADGAHRVPNPFLDACDDPLIWALVLYVEDEGERHAIRMLES